MGSNQQELVRMENISIEFPGVKALDMVSFNVLAGEVHALVGENGAGKSTLIKVLMGVYTPSNGKLYVNGKEANYRTPAEAIAQGMGAVYQDITMATHLTVGENFFLGHLPTTGGKVNWKKIFKDSQATLDDLKIDIDARSLVRDLTIGQQEMVSIAKIIHQKANVLVFDEPTALLTNEEVETLFNLIKDLKARGYGIIYISHRMEEIFDICDRVTVFRDGKYIDTTDVASVTRAQLVKMMVGRDMGSENYHKEQPVPENTVLEVKNFTDADNRFRNINFKLNKGEILGLAGLVGAGRTELVRAIFGADTRHSGEIFLNSKKVEIKCPHDAIQNGIMLIPEDRKIQGFVPGLSNTANVALSNLDRYKKGPVLNFGYMNKQVKELTDQLDVHPADNNLKTSQLSGGNQQKIVVAKALNVEPDILILDEPTRGIDVNAKHEIYELIRRLADSGKSIILISSELPEVLKMSDRILIMYEGRMTGELDGKEAVEDSVMYYAVGGSDDEKHI